MSVRRLHTFNDDALGEHDGVELAQMLRRGEVSAGELIEAAIARAELATPLSAIVLRSFERARAETRGSKQSGAFAGIPTFIKDQLDIEGLPTRYGSEAHANARPARKTDPVVRQLFDMGLISLGKSTLPEYGMVPSTEFPTAEPTRNPWNLDRTAGGSSGGSAALVSAGVVPIAHTADGGGSTRIPAACCGLVGMKPSRGRLPNSAMQDPFVGITTDGVVTRSVRDTALYLAEAERLRPMRSLRPVGLNHRPSTRKLRIGAVVASPFGAVLDEATDRELHASLQLLRDLGHEVEQIEPTISKQFANDFLAFWALLGGLIAVTSRVLKDPSFDRKRLSKFTRGLGEEARKSAFSMPGVVRRLRRSAREAVEVFETLDVVVSPTLGQVAPLLGHLNIEQSYEALSPKLFDWVCFTPWANAAGVPALSLPLGFDDATSLPVGVMFTAAVGEERMLLELGLQLEQARPFRRIQDL